MMSSVTSSIDGAFAIAQSLTPVEKLELISRLWEDIRVRSDFRPSDSDLARSNAAGRTTKPVK
jgi:hypothetical protein